MEEHSDNEEFTQSGHVQLKEGINLQSVLQGETFEINFDNIQNDYEDTYNPKDLDAADLTGASLGIDSDDDEDDINSTPFEKLSNKMTNVTEDGKIKKKIKREGTGETPPANSLVCVHYSSYLEYHDEPTDYAYIKKPFQFRLGHAGIFGLNIAVQSMKVNEKSMFLIGPEYAFGKMGHPPRIPANATFLFLVELLRFVDSGPALELSKLSLEEKRQFPVAYRTAQGLRESAKEYFSKHNLKLSIRDYNKAVSLLEECSLSDITEQEKQQQMLFKLYTNLAVCYTKDCNPRRACTMCNNIYAMSKNTSLSIPAKVFFHNGRALLMLGDFKKARERLLKAQRLEPRNVEISNELAKVSAKIKEEEKREKQFAKALLQNKETKPSAPPAEPKKEVQDSFTLIIREQLQALKANVELSQVKLPPGLTEKEIDIAKGEAQRAGLKFRLSKNNENDGIMTYYISRM